MPESVVPVKLAAWTSLGIRFVPLEEAICIANDSSSPCSEHLLGFIETPAFEMDRGHPV